MIEDPRHEEKLADLSVQSLSISNNLWAVYAATASIVLGLSIAGAVEPTANELLSRTAEAWVRGAITVGFTSFSLGNFLLLLKAYSVEKSLKDSMKKLKESQETSLFRSSLSVFSEGNVSPKYVWYFHLTIDLCVYAALWMPFYVAGQ